MGWMVKGSLMPDGVLEKKKANLEKDGVSGPP